MKQKEPSGPHAGINTPRTPCAWEPSPRGTSMQPGEIQLRAFREEINPSQQHSGIGRGVREARRTGTALQREPSLSSCRQGSQEAQPAKQDRFPHQEDANCPRKFTFPARTTAVPLLSQGSTISSSYLYHKPTERSRRCLQKCLQEQQASCGGGSFTSSQGRKGARAACQ